MYVPGHFAFDDAAAQFDFVDRFGFATLISAGGGGMMVSHLPLMLDRTRNVLIGHMARPNPHVRCLTEGNMASLAIFHGPHAYVSPLWYAAEAAVPTWNYSAVHISGQLRLVDDECALCDSLRKLVRHFDRDAEAALAKSELVMQKLARGIVGFEMTIERVEGKHKLSQNRSVEDRAGVYAGLNMAREHEARNLAAWMAELGVVDVEVRA
jgi:transcriptional regulator